TVFDGDAKIVGSAEDDPVSPIAPTLAANGLASAPAPLRRGAPPITATPVLGYGPSGPVARSALKPIDRNAPTRPSEPLAGVRAAPNDTEMVEQARTTEQAAARSSGGVSGAPGIDMRSDRVFPAVQRSSATGPLAGEARRRASDRGPFVLVGAAAV